jgi:HlyD family secretion protein
MKRRYLITIAVVIIAAVVIGIVFATGGFSSGSPSAFQTVPIEKGDLTAIVGATGKVRANQSAALTWQTGGRIKKINAAVSDQVVTDYILAELDETSLAQNIIQARADLVDARRELDNLLNSDTSRAKAYQALVQAQKELDDALEKRESKQYARAGTNNLDIARADLVIAEDEVTKAERYYDQFDGLSEGDPLRAYALSQLANSRKSRDTYQANLNWLLGRPDPQEVAEADANVEVARANLADAEREWERSRDGPNPDDIEAARARIAALEATINQAYIKAPFSGTVTESHSKPGDQVSTGTASFRIDDLSRILVDMNIPEVDINAVRVGFPVRMTFDAISAKEYQGQVIEVARVGVEDQGVVNFLTTVEIQDAYDEVKPGMTAAVNIVVNQISDVLLVPNRAVRLREGKRVIYLLRENEQQEVEITIGATSDTVSEILSGDVNAGDLVILNPQIVQDFGPPGFTRSN